MFVACDCNEPDLCDRGEKQMSHCENSPCGLAAAGIASRVGVAMVLTCLVGTTGFAADSATSMVELADGVYQFLSPDIDGIAVDGNSIAILNERDVLVFDTNVLPSTAMAVLSDIRKLTAKPVRYAVNSHWHPDHWDGNELYARNFPDLEIIASETTRRLMQNTMKVYVKTLEFEMKGSNKEFADQLRTGKSADGKKLNEADRKEIRSTLQAEQNFLAEYNHRQPVLPTLTFQRKLTLYHGGRVFELLELPGNTAGDTVLYLSKEKILLTGDLLVYPIPYMASSHPNAWIESLEALERLDAQVIVPGHGAAQHDKEYLHLVTDSLKFVVAQVHEALQRGMTLDEAQKFVNLDSLRTKFTHDDPQLNLDFQGNFAPIIRRAYDEATEELELYQ
jgi:cyclase